MLCFCFLIIKLDLFKATSSVMKSSSPETCTRMARTEKNENLENLKPKIRQERLILQRKRCY